MPVRPPGARTAVRGEVAEATGLPEGQMEWSPERPDAVFEGGRQLGLGRRQVGS